MACFDSGSITFCPHEGFGNAFISALLRLGGLTLRVSDTEVRASCAGLWQWPVLLQLACLPIFAACSGKTKTVACLWEFMEFIAI